MYEKNVLDTYQKCIVCMGKVDIKNTRFKNVNHVFQNVKHVYFLEIYKNVKFIWKNVEIKTYILKI